MKLYEDGLDKNPANHLPLSPLGFLSRSAMLYPNHVAVVHGERKITYTEFNERSLRLASALSGLGVTLGTTVSIIAANIPEHLEAHFGVPMCGAVLNSINTRLDAKSIAYILDHAECQVLLVDNAFSEVIKEALALCSAAPYIIDIADPLLEGNELIGKVEYQEFIAQGDSNYNSQHPLDEWQAFSLNYTSGTTGNPKGVVYSHRGAYLNSMGNQLTWSMSSQPVYLWTLPMFHCNGWCFPWTITALGGTHVCLRDIEANAIITSIIDNQVTHFCGAPIVLNMIINGPESIRKNLPEGIKVMTAGAPPPAAVIKGCEELGMDITQTYGLTEVYGPCVVSEWKSEWDALAIDERAALKARQGVRYLTQEHVDVLSPETMETVPNDGETIGEIMFRGNTTMKGYLKSPMTTNESFSNGWFHSGDLAVKHADGYIEIRDRSKDIIISGGENISSVEVEGVLYSHPAILEAAVVAKPHSKWGETPCAFVTLKPGCDASEDDIIAFCRDNLASFKLPKSIVFGDLPKTSTGKIQKYLLRESFKASS